MQNLKLSTSNIYEEKITNFNKTKTAKRLREKYKPKPYEERYKSIYLIGLITSYFCNLFSILTASTFVFTYLLSIVKELPYPLLIAGAFTSGLLLIIETLQRTISPLFFRQILQYGYKTRFLWLLIVIVSLSSLSILFSYKGGYDVVTVLSTEPTKEAPLLYDIEKVKNEYKSLIDESSRDAESYKKSKQWKNRLSDKHSKQYIALLNETAKLRKDQRAKISDYERLNREKEVSSTLSYNNAIADYNSSNVSKGGGLSKFTIIAQLVFFLCILFMEIYDYRTASQYVLIESTYKETPATTKQPPAPYSTFALNRNEIGFKTDNQSKHSNIAKPLLQRTKTPPAVTVTAQDKRTIKHICKQTGEAKYYTLQQVKNFVKVYLSRYNKALREGKDQVAQSRQETLDYWRDKQNILTEYEELNA